MFEIQLKILQGRAAPEVKSRLYENTVVRYSNPTHPSSCYYVLFYSLARYPYDSFGERTTVRPMVGLALELSCWRCYLRYKEVHMISSFVTT